MDWSQVGALIAGCAGVVVLHSYLVVPRMIAEARKEWREDIELSIDPIDTAIEAHKEQLTRIEAKVDTAISGGRA